MGLLDSITGGDWLKAGAGLFSGILGAESQSDINAQNLAFARGSQDFQERMSDTAHQREAADLTAAGLNPILTANRGASSPLGVQAPMISSPYMAGVNAATGTSQGALNWAHSAQANQETETEKERTSQEAFKSKQNDWILEHKGMFDKWMANHVWQQEYSTQIQEKTVEKMVAELSNLAKAGKLIDEQSARTAAETVLRRLEVPEAQAFAEFFASSLGKFVPWKREGERFIQTVKPFGFGR